MNTCRTCRPLEPPPTTKTLDWAIRHARRSQDNDRRALMIVVGEMWHALNRSTVPRSGRRLSLSLDDKSIVNIAMTWIENGACKCTAFTSSMAETGQMTPQELLRQISRT